MDQITKIKYQFLLTVEIDESEPNKRPADIARLIDLELTGHPFKKIEISQFVGNAVPVGEYKQTTNQVKP